MSLTDSDLEQVAGALERFTRQQVLPASLPYERPMAAAQLAALLDELTELGLFELDEDCPSLWADSQDGGSTQLSVQVLRLLASANAALALSAHRRAQTTVLLKALGWEAPACALLGSGHFGLARLSLGRWLDGRAEAEDQALLADWLDRHKPSVLLAPDAWSHLLWPVWVENSLQWQLSSRPTLHCTVQQSLGLDELAACSVYAQGEPLKRSQLAPEQARELYLWWLKTELLGLSAIGLGVLDHGAKMAHDYAQIRRQGAQLIGQHPAVQLMLSEIDSSRLQLAHQLNNSRQGLANVALAELVALRLTSNSALLTASHQVIQIHGGIGYMRDLGPEKLMRDQTMLRLISGGVASLGLLLQGALL